VRPGAGSYSPHSGRLVGLLENVILLERLARDKQSSLLGTFVNYIGKMFYNVPPDSQIGTFVYLFYI
jgi:hypothetical protein